MAHHKRKRPKHRRSGCLLCKPHKLTTNAKGERRRSRQASLEHERAADEEAEAIAADRIKSGAADHKENGAKALERLGIGIPLLRPGASGGIVFPVEAALDFAPQSEKAALGVVGRLEAPGTRSEKSPSGFGDSTASAGLVTTLGRGATWSASGTKAGQRYLKQAGSEGPPVARQASVSVTPAVGDD
jgi:hypothetical protein